MAQKTQPLVSILLPTHNRADIINVAIESVLNQSMTDFELLVVGDGCTDHTEEVVLRYVRRDNRVKWLPFAKGKGFGYAHRSKAMKQMRGTYGAYMAHDDLWFGDHLETLIAFLVDHPELPIAYTRPLWVHPLGVVLPSTFNVQAPEMECLFFADHNEIPAVCFAFRLTAVAQVGYWNAQLPAAADWDLWKRVAGFDVDKIGFLTQPTTLHFKANWRQGNEAGMDNILRDMYAEIEAHADFKHILAVKSRPDQVQQKVFAALLKKPMAVAKLRAMSQAYLDARARRLQPRQTEAELMQLKEDIRRITSTRGYRLMERLRGMIKAWAIFRYLPW